MASLISAGTSTNTAVSITGDTTGALALATNNGTTAVTIDTSQNVGIGSTPVNSRRLTVNTSGQTDLSIVAGSTNYGQLLFGYTGADNKGILAYNNSDNSMQFYANSAERMRIDSSGNVGIGVTPSASWASGSTALQLGNGAIWKSGSRSVDWITNGYYNGTNYIYNTSNPATYYRQYDGTHYWYNAVSGTAGNAITFINTMTLDSSGNLGINQSASYKLDVADNANGPVVRVINNRDTTGSYGVKVTLGSSGGAGTTGSAHFHGNTNAVGNWYLYGNGTTSYSSDQRLKKNIETTRNGYLEDLAKLRVVKFNWNVAPEGTPKELGLIAQEVEQVFPGLVQNDANPVTEGDDTVYKQLKQSVLPYMLLKAIQELKTIVDAQAVEIAALKAKVGA